MASRCSLSSLLNHLKTNINYILSFLPGSFTSSWRSGISSYRLGGSGRFSLAFLFLSVSCCPFIIWFSVEVPRPCQIQFSGDDYGWIWGVYTSCQRFHRLLPTRRWGRCTAYEDPGIQQVLFDYIKYDTYRVFVFFLLNFTLSALRNSVDMWRNGGCPGLLWWAGVTVG